MGWRRSRPSITKVVISWGALRFIWSLSGGFPTSWRFRLTAPRLLLDDCDAWTWNASLTTLSSYRKCSKRRTSGHSAPATSPLPIEGTTICSRTAPGFGSGSGMVSVADLRAQ